MTPRLIIFIILLIGIALFSYSLTLPYYKDQKTADELIDKSYDIDKATYYKKEAQLRTPKLSFMDVGAGLSVASLTILVFLLARKIRHFSDFHKMVSLKRTAIFIISNLTWLIMIPGTIWYYTFRGGRGDYPPFADSIGIPINQQTTGFLFLIIPINLFLLIATVKSSLPARIFIKADEYVGSTIFWEVFFGFWLLLNMFCFITFVIGGDHVSIIVNLIFTYILLNLRAGKINMWKTEDDIAINNMEAAL
jgi:hypothetical protein